MELAIVFLYNNFLYYTTIAEHKQIVIGSHKKDNVYIDSLKNSRIILSWEKDGLKVTAKKTDIIDNNLKNESVDFNKYKILGKKNKVALFVSVADKFEANKVDIPYNCKFDLGRDDDNDIVINNSYVSNVHITFRNEAGNIRVEDKNSKNGVFLNGKRISVAKMKSGDVLNILSIRIKLENNALYFENVGKNIKIKKISNFNGYTDVAETKSEGGFVLYQRSPRIQEKLPTEDIILSSPPTKGPKMGKGRGILPSLFSTGSMIATSFLYGAASPALIAARAASAVSPIAGMASSAGSNNRSIKKAKEYEKLCDEKYGAYIKDQKAKIDSVAESQRNIIIRENPNPSECNDILFGLKKNLWERKNSDRDFLDIRIGMGYEDLCVKVKSRSDFNGFQMESDESKELTEQIIEATRIVDNIPKRLSLLKNNTIGVIGDRTRIIRFIKNIITELTVTHCFDEVKLVGLFDADEKEIWESIKWFPHIWDDNKETRFLAFYNKQNNRDKVVHKICDYLNEVFKDRTDNLRQNFMNKITVQKPHYIVFIGSKHIAEKESIMNTLLANNPSLGVTTFFLFDDLFSLPHECKFILDLDNGPSGYVRDEVNEKFFFTEDYSSSITEQQFEKFARKMSSIKLKGFAKEKEIPNSITFLEGYGCNDVKSLNVIERWNRSQPHRSLRAPIGMLSGGRTFYFDIHEEAHGPHGLVAGTTGSGKSELLISWILSMAVNYHPHDVAFVLIDYKGGGMSSGLKELPHIIGEITNIDTNISRALISLNSEKERRERIFNQYRNNLDTLNIYEYQKLYKSGRAKYPIPHLIIVCDEFAELKTEEPQFIKELIRIARVGRSLGIYLVLATQKPGGIVDDQIRGNSKFRLCLKVADAVDSREMLKRPDAASLKQTGRCFIRVGEDEYFDLFQSYWSGAPYYENVQKRNQISNSVSEVLINGERRKSKRNKENNELARSEIKAIVDHIKCVAKENCITKLDGPWLPELPEQFPLQKIIGANAFDGINWKRRSCFLSIPIGIFDKPEEQKQGVLYIDFIKDGHYGIYGAPSTGKTNILKTIIASLGILYTPDEVNIYGIDCGGWSMSVFSQMPHVGGIALDCEEEKIEKLQQMIINEIENRKRLFYRNMVSSFTSYRENVSSKLPAIIIVIDNIISLFDLYPDIETMLISVAREGSTYGIYLVYTSNSITGVKYKVMQNIKGAIALELNDRGDYSSLVGKLEGMATPQRAGRGFLKSNPPVDFQAAICAQGENDAQRNSYLKDLFTKMHTVWNGNLPKSIPVMPEHFGIEELRKTYNIRTSVPVGISYESVDVLSIDLSDKYSMLVSGTIDSGQSKILVNISKLILDRYPETKVYVFDNKKADMIGMQKSVYKHTFSNDDEAVSLMLNEIVENLNVRKRSQNKCMAETEDFDEKKFIYNYELIVVIIADLKEFIDDVSNENKNLMERICRLAQNLGIIVISAGNISDILKYNEIDTLTRVIVGNQNGISVSGTPSVHNYFRNNLNYNEKNIEAGEGNAYAFINGKCIKIKLPDR